MPTPHFVGDYTINSIEYSTGVHWVSRKPAVYETGIKGLTIVSDYVILAPSGRLFLPDNYAIDGITGITGWPWERLLARPWLKNNCWHHDGFCQLVRLGLLDASYIPQIHEEFLRGCIRDGAWKWQAEIAYRMVSKFGNPKANTEHLNRPVLIAP